MSRHAFALLGTLAVLACDGSSSATPTASTAAPVDGGAIAAAKSSQTMPGRWTLTVSVPGLGTFPINCTFRHQDNGSCDFGGASLPLVYRQAAANVAASFEIPAPNSPTGIGFTMNFRFVMTTDNTVMGKAILVTDTPDASPLGFLIVPGMVTGQRQ